ncbi:MAG: NmrA family NAD(P)-binding protein [Planctomycetaceae bacterium]|nr:NmrA family NAD(P)-binding protein [Planctomycetaceae bacterium]
MDIVLGATGRVGSALASALLTRGRRVRAVVRNAAKAQRLRQMGASIALADFTDAATLHSAFAGGDSVFVVTAEDPASHDAIAEAEAFLGACRNAIRAAGVRRVIGLSSDGAQHATGTGHLMVSHMLEHAFDDMGVETVFIRPSYYYSNWMLSVPVAKERGVVPTFFPVDLAVPMIAPEDVAQFAAMVFAEEVGPRRVHEITGPCFYSASDIAAMFGELLGRTVTAQRIPEESWLDSLMQAGFSPANAQYMAEMTAAVISGLTATEGDARVMPTLFRAYAQPLLAGT